LSIREEEVGDVSPDRGGVVDVCAGCSEIEAAPVICEKEGPQLPETGRAKYDLCNSTETLLDNPVRPTPPVAAITAFPLPPSNPTAKLEAEAMLRWLWKLAGISLSDDVRNGELNGEPGVSASRGEPRPLARIENVTGLEWN
jgi:hypothetical protein